VSNFYALIFILLTAAMAFLFGPIGLFPSVYFFVSNAHSIVSKNNQHLTKNYTPPNLGVILVLVLALVVFCYGAIKFIYSEKDLAVALADILKNNIYDTGVMRKMDMIPHSRTIANLVLIQLGSIFSLLIVSILFLPKKIKFLQSVSYYRNIELQKEKEKPNTFPMGIAIFFIAFVIFNILPYLDPSHRVELRDSPDIRSMITSATYFPIALVMDFFMLVLLTRKIRTRTPHEEHPEYK
jgi:NADH:ubiquinone oxidoreductase subunit 5 (subunit L)/multisubunit Na+/H+ antiporter MnhA subunit